MVSTAKNTAVLSARKLSPRCELDPIASWLVELLEAIHGQQAAPWPSRSRGMRSLLESSPLGRGRTDAPSAQLDLQEVLSRRLHSENDAPRGAIRVHSTLAGLVASAQAVICSYGWFLDPTVAVFICPDQAEAKQIETLLRRDEDRDRDQDLMAAARWVAEQWPLYPGWRYSGSSPILLADEIPSGACWREVFLSPGCRGLKAEQLLPAVRAAGVGVHVMATASTSPTGRDHYMWSHALCGS